MAYKVGADPEKVSAKPEKVAADLKKSWCRSRKGQPEKDAAD